MTIILITFTFTDTCLSRYYIPGAHFTHTHSHTPNSRIICVCECPTYTHADPHIKQRAIRKKTFYSSDTHTHTTYPRRKVNFHVSSYIVEAIFIYSQTNTRKTVYKILNILPKSEKIDLGLLIA